MILRFWSPVLGCQAARVSAFDRYGGEHFAVIAQGAGGRANREVRFRALELVERAAAQGSLGARDPGPVRIEMEAA